MSPGKHFLRVQDPVTGRADGVTVDVVSGKSSSYTLSLRALNEEQRRALFAAEAAVKPALPTRVEVVPDAGVTDEVVPPWVDEDEQSKPDE